MHVAEGGPGKKFTLYPLPKREIQFFIIILELSCLILKKTLTLLLLDILMFEKGDSAVELKGI